MAWQLSVDKQKDENAIREVGGKKVYDSIVKVMDEVIPLLKYDTRLDTKRIEDNTSYVLQDFVISKIIRYLNDDRYTLDSVKQSLIKFIDNYKGYIVSCIVEDDYGDRDGDTVRTITTVPIYIEKYYTQTHRLLTSWHILEGMVIMNFLRVHILLPRSILLI